jgi:hypothetical protein
VVKAVVKCNFWGTFRWAVKSRKSTAFQGLPAFRFRTARIPARHSQTTRATNCATPGYFFILPQNRRKTKGIFPGIPPVAAAPPALISNYPPPGVLPGGG